MILRHSFCRALFALLLFSITSAAQTRSPVPANKLERIEKAISSEISRQNIPGLSAAIVTDHQLTWSNGYGLADVENSVPAKAGTVYRLASISKPITAIALMQLAERGKFDLDAPIQKYCPAFPEKPWPITARQLLGHLAGIRHYKGDEITSTRRYSNVVEGLDIFKDDPLLHEPGTKYFYTTYGYSVLGCAVEGGSGMKFVDFVRENIFKPAGMDRMRADDVFEIIPNRAQGYSKTQSGQLNNSGLADTSYKIPGGGFVSTVEDLARFAIAVQKGSLVKQGTLEEMWTAQKTRDQRGSAASSNTSTTGYGLGWSVSQRDGRKEVAHGGGQQRVSTYLFMLPEKRLAVALMTNLEGVGSSLSNLASQISDILLEK